MVFTDRYLKLPVEMHNRKEAELTGNGDAGSFIGYAKVLPMEIASWMPVYDADERILEQTNITFKHGGTDMLLPIGIHEFEKLLNDFMK